MQLIINGEESINKFSSNYEVMKPAVLSTIN